MGVISAINAMNASMNATRLSSVNLASALETYAAVIASPPPPPYSSSPCSPVHTSQNEARGMCFTHAAVFWMEWATIQANLQLSLMQDLFKLKSLTDLAGERKRGVDIDIEPHEFDILEADSIRSLIVKLTKLSHDSFQEGYSKGTDWNGVGGLDYWITQVEHYDATIPRAPSMAASKLSHSLNTPPCSITSTLESDSMMKATRADQDNFSLRRKRNNEDLRGSKASDNDSDSSHSRQYESDDTLENEIPSDITNSQRTAKVTEELPESDHDDVQILCRYPRDEKVDNPNNSTHPTSPEPHEQSESSATETTDIGLADTPAGWSGLCDISLTDTLTMAAPARPLESAPQDESCHKGVISYYGIDEERNILDDSDNESGSTDYESASSDRSSSGGSDFDNFFHDAIDSPARRASGGLNIHKQESALEDQKSWLESICSIGRPKMAVTHEITDWRSIESNIDDPYFPDPSSSPGNYVYHHVPYAITEEGTLKSIAPSYERVNVRSIFSTTNPESSEHAFPGGVGIRRKGKFQKKNGYLQMLATEEEGWEDNDFSAGERGVVEFQKGTYSNQRLEIPVDVGNIVSLPKHSKLGYFTEDFHQTTTIVDKERANSSHPRWARLSCAGEPQPQPTRRIRMDTYGDEIPTLLKRMRRNCFKGDEDDSE